jgi:uncharacterized protein
MLAMNDSGDIARLLTTAPALLDLLREVASLGLPQGCIAAGMVRNAVWDALHGRAPGLHPRSDIDVLYFEPSVLAPEREAQLEAELHARRPDVTWQVRNQARMHERNGDAPYRSCCDALRYFPEVATALSARLVDERVIIDAPLGVSDLFELIVRPTPHFARKPDVYRARLASKDWAQRWPRLRFLDA